MVVDGTAALVASIFGNWGDENDASREQRAALERLLADWQQSYQTTRAQLQASFLKIQELSEQNVTLRSMHLQLLHRTHEAEAKAITAESRAHHEQVARESTEKELAWIKTEAT